MKRWQRNILLGIVGFIMLILLLPMVIYIPPVQRAATQYAQTWIAENTPMRLTLSQFSLKFPLRLVLEDVVVITEQNDTLVHSGMLHADVALVPLLRGKIAIRDIALHNSHIDYITADSSLRVRARAGELGIDNGTILLGKSKVYVEDIRLERSQIELWYHASPDTATTDSQPLEWQLEIDNIRLADIGYTMYMPGTIDTLQIVLPEAHIRQGDVSLLHQTVDVKSIDLNRSSYRYIARNNTAQTAAETSAQNDTTATQPWQVQVGKVALADNRVEYITSYQSPAQGIDFSHIVADKVNVAISDIYNRGGDLWLRIDNVAMHERSGIYITQAQGDFAMQETGMTTLSDFSLKTPFSDMSADAAIDLRLLDQHPEATLRLLANAHISSRDIVAAFPQAQKLFVHDYNEERWAAIDDIFTLDVEAVGKGSDIAVKRLDLLQPGIFTFKSDARLAHLLDKSRRNIVFSGRLNTTEQLSLTNYIPDSTLTARLVMQPIAMDANVHLVGSDMTADAWIECMNGTVDLDAAYNLDSEAYNAQVDIARLPLDILLQHDTVGNLSAHATLAGRHFSLDNPDMTIEAQVAIDTLEYKRYQYRGIELQASAKEEKWMLNLNSRQQEADLQLNASGLYKKDLLTADLDAKINMLDLASLNLAQQPLDIATNIQAEVVLSNIDSIVQAYVAVDSIELGIGDYVYYTNSMTLLAASDITYSYIDFNTGDMAVNLSSDAGLTHLRPSLERLTQFVDTIFQKQRLNMDELHRGLPPFVFSAHVGADNILHRYLSSKGIGLSTAHVDVSNDSLFNMSALVQRLKVSNMQLDTITLKAYEKEDRLNYNLALGNRPGNLDDFAHVRIEGFLSGNSTRLYCLQNNRAGDTGFLFGCKIDFLPDLVQLTFGPKEPIIGYKKWQLNKDNFLTYNHAKHNLDADVRLSYENSHLYITTEDRRNADIGGAHIDLQNIELSDWFAVTPFVTSMSGLLSADVYIETPDKELEASGAIELVDFTYNARKVGSFDADIKYLMDAQGGSKIEMAVLRDNTNILDGNIYLAGGTSKLINGEVTIDKLPLMVANAFLPNNTGEVSGALNSHLTLSGSVDRPNINGFIRFDDARMQMNNIGVALALDNDDITINNSRISLKSYGIRGANKEPLNISGSLDFSNLSDVGVNIDLKGNNFQPIQSAENRMAMLYGSVYTDVDARVRGSLNDLKVNGDISLLSGTDATYIMQSNSMMSGSDYSDMVSFVSFADTLAEHTQDNRLKRKASLSATVDIDIDQGVQLGVNLSPDGNNRIDLVGGGNLLYTASALGDNHVTGRYVLTGGFVRYTPPFISQKIFNIEDGSYVLWSGDIADPTFNITAVQSQRSTVKTGDESRLVDFDVSIIISNTLKNLDISFDLATTDDLAIQNELQSLTEEQRETKAMNMFLYNSYDNLAAAAEDAFINNPLNTFLEYELNTWAQRTLRGVDLTFGIDNYGLDEAGLQRTDYSYQFSKSLLDNRLKFVIGGSYASNQDVTQNLRENLIDDISLEYRLTKRENMYLKVFRQTGYESIIEGEITQTGAGFLFRKQVKSLLDLFRKKPQATPEKENKTQPQEAATDSVPPVAQPITTVDSKQ
ncbi:MAG: translocation/assembly module TamB domain-containing protein [Bacteroidaceae bacterium]|nr:translocation/assembly module TamB domain-containing protein [Bacteroidaceae bacterium]